MVMSVAPTIAELPLQDIRFLFGTIPQIRMLPNKLTQTGKAGIGEFKLVGHFPASHGGTEADKKAYLNRHAGFQGGDYSIYYDGTYTIDEMNWDATNRAGVHLVTQDKYGNTVQFPVVPSKSVPGDLKLLVSEYVESILNPPLMVRCSAIGGRLTPDPNTPNTFDLSVNPQQPKCPVKARPHVPQQYHAEEMTMDHGRYVVDASALNDSEIEYLDFYLYGSETFNSPYAGGSALSGVGLSTNQLTSTIGTGTFDEASLNSSGHMNVFANAEEGNTPFHLANTMDASQQEDTDELKARASSPIIADYIQDMAEWGFNNQDHTLLWDSMCLIIEADERGEFEEHIDMLLDYESEEGNAPVQDPMEFGEMANWRPLDGTPGLSKRKRAETLMDSGSRNAYATVNFEWTCQGLPEGFDDYSEIEDQVVKQIGYVTGNSNMDLNRHYDTMEVEIDGVFYPCEFEYQLDFDEINYHSAEQ